MSPLQHLASRAASSILSQLAVREDKNCINEEGGDMCALPNAGTNTTPIVIGSIGYVLALRLSRSSKQILHVPSSLTSAQSLQWCPRHRHCCCPHPPPPPPPAHGRQRVDRQERPGARRLRPEQRRRLWSHEAKEHIPGRGRSRQERAARGGSSIIRPIRCPTIVTGLIALPRNVASSAAQAGRHGLGDSFVCSGCASLARRVFRSKHGCGHPRLCAW